MINFYTFTLLLMPLLNALSWLLGGALLSKIDPYSLSTLRTLIVAIILILTLLITERSHFSKILQSKNLKWWKDQLVLSLSGRVLYYYYSAKSMLSISPLEAIIITTLMPILALAAEKIYSKIDLSAGTIVMGIFACTFGIISIFLSTESRLVSFKIGHVEMLFAVAAFAFHTVYYKAKVKDSSPTILLMAQFSIGAVLMLPFLPHTAITQFANLDLSNWFRFLFYSIICGLGPFVLLHYCLKKYDPFIVLTFSLLSPLFAILLRGVYKYTPISNSFVICTIFTCIFAIGTLAVNSKYKTIKRGQQ